MTDRQLETKIREAFDSHHVPSPGLEERVIAAVPWQTQPPRSSFGPRLAGTFAVILAVAVIVVLIASTILTRLGSPVPLRPPLPRR